MSEDETELIQLRYSMGQIKNRNLGVRLGFSDCLCWQNVLLSDIIVQVNSFVCIVFFDRTKDRNSWNKSREAVQ